MTKSTKKELNYYDLYTGRCINREVKNYPGENRMFQKNTIAELERINTAEWFNIENYIKYKFRATKKTLLITDKEKQEQYDYYHKQQAIKRKLEEKRRLAEERFFNSL